MSLTIDERRERFIRELKEDLERGYQESLKQAEQLKQRRAAAAKKPAKKSDFLKAKS